MDQFENMYFMVQLRQDAHGFYPKTKEIAKQLQISSSAVSNYYNRVVKKLQDKAYLEEIQKEIPHFDLLWKDFVDSRTRCDLSKRQRQILALRFEEKEDRIRKRSPKEIADAISTDIIHFDEVFVKTQQKKIESLFYTHKDLKEKYQVLLKHYLKKRSIKIRETEKNYLTIQLKQDAHGFYPKTKEVAKQLQVSSSAITNYHSQIARKLQNPLYLEELEKEIPHFRVLWEALVDSKIEEDLSRCQRQILRETFEMREGTLRERTPKEIAEIISTDVLHFDEVFVKTQQERITSLFRSLPLLEEKYRALLPYDDFFKNKNNSSIRLTKKERNYLVAQLKQDRHGFYPKECDVAEQLQIAPITIPKYYRKMIIKLQNKAYLEKVQQEIPHFDLFWEAFQDSKTRGDLSKRQQQILALQFEEKEGIIRKRSPKEIAEAISTEILQFDEVFVKMQQKQIENLFHYHKELREKYQVPLPQQKEDSLALTQKERDYLSVQLKRDAHGLYPRDKDVCTQLHLSSSAVSRCYERVSRKLCYHAYLEEVRKEIPHFDLFWEEFKDSKTRGDLSKRQQQILALQFEEKEGIIRKRDLKEIAEAISTEQLSYDEVFVRVQKQKIENLFRHHPKLREKYQMTSCTPTQQEKNYLIAQLKQDTHGFYPTSGEIKEQLQISYKSIQKYYKQIVSKLQNKTYLETLQREIPHFDLLWENFMDSKTRCDLSRRQQQILKERFEIKEDGVIHRRTPKEIAEVISTEVLHFDEVYVKSQQRTIERLFYNHKELKEKYQRGPSYTRKVQLTEEDVLLLKEKYRFDPVTKRYFSSQEQAKKIGAPVKNLVIQDALLLEKLGQPTVKENRNQEKTLIFSELESSIFHDFVALCSDNEKQALALRLGYFDGLIHETEEVAKLCHLNSEDVSHLTRNCLQAGKETLEGLIQKSHQKKKS